MPRRYSYIVEIEGNTGFILDSNQLDVGLLGYLQTDLTSYVQSVSVKTGRSTIQDKFSAGQMSIVFDNRSRAFDPNYASSPLYGTIVPRRKIIFSIFNTDLQFATPVFFGYVDSWSFDYDVSGDSTATASCSDPFTILSNQNITLTTPPAESTESRITRVLTNSAVAFPMELVSINDDVFTMGTASYSGDALSYLQQLTDSERGYMFASPYNGLQFNLWGSFVSPPDPLNYGWVFTDTSGGGWPFTKIETTYDTDQFYNYVTVSGYPGSSVAQDTTSQANYGISYGDFPVLNSTTGQMAYIATFLRNKYGTPRFRVSKLTVSLDSAYFDNYYQIPELANLQIGYYVRIYWTPNNVGTPVDQYAFIIGKDIQATPEGCEFTFSFSGDEIRGSYP
jgi:hypothetical protein